MQPGTSEWLSKAVAGNTTGRSTAAAAVLAGRAPRTALVPALTVGAARLGYVADARVAELLRNIFEKNEWKNITAMTRLHLTSGAYSWGRGNVCLLELAREGALRERLLHAPVLAEVLTSMATAWDPDFAVATSTQMMELVEKRKSEVRVGWLTYLSRRLGQVPPLPAPVRIEPVGQLGWLLVLYPEPMTASNPEHVALTARVRELLDRAGLIHRPAPASADP